MKPCLTTKTKVDCFLLNQRAQRNFMMRIIPMNEYLVTAYLPTLFDGEAASLSGEQLAYARRLMEEGTITSYSLSLDRKMFWLTLLAHSTGEAEQALNKLPMFGRMRHEIVELLYHAAHIPALTRFSLN
jgi:muconolactone delta-isomerase